MYDKPVSKLTRAELIALGDLSTQNALDDADILAALTPSGYDADRIGQGRALLGTVQTSTLQQGDLHGRQVQATSDFKAAWQAFREGDFATHTGHARIVFKKEPGTLRRLGLAPALRSKAFNAWLRKARQFYETALSDESLRTRLAARSVTEEALTAGLAEVNRLAGLDRAQEDLKGRKQQVTRTLDLAEKDLRAWIGEYRDTARLALKDRPDWTERLGFRTSST